MQSKISIRKIITTYAIGILSCICMTIARKYLSINSYNFIGSAISLTTIALASVPDIIGLLTQDDWILHVGWWGAKYQQRINADYYRKLSYVKLIALIFFLPIYQFINGHTYSFIAICYAYFVWLFFRIFAFYQGLYIFAKSISGNPNKLQNIDLDIFNGLSLLNFNKFTYRFICFSIFILLVLYIQVIFSGIDINTLCCVTVSIVVLHSGFFACNQQNFIWLKLKTYLVHKGKCIGLQDKTYCAEQFTSEDMICFRYERNINFLLSVIMYLGCISFLVCF